MKRALIREAIDLALLILVFLGGWGLTVLFDLPLAGSLLVGVALALLAGILSAYLQGFFNL